MFLAVRSVGSAPSPTASIRSTQRVAAKSRRSRSGVGPPGPDSSAMPRTVAPVAAAS